MILVKSSLLIGPVAAFFPNPEMIRNGCCIHRQYNLYGICLFQIEFPQKKAAVGSVCINAALPNPGVQGRIFCMEKMKGEQSGLYHFGYFPVLDLSVKGQSSAG